MQRQGQRSRWTGWYVGDGSSSRHATPTQLLTHTPPTRLYATPGWILESPREIHPSTYICPQWGGNVNKILTSKVSTWDTDYPTQCVSIFGVTQCNNVLLKISFNIIGCSDIINYKVTLVGKTLRSHDIVIALRNFEQYHALINQDIQCSVGLVPFF